MVEIAWKVTTVQHCPTMPQNLPECHYFNIVSTGKMNTFGCWMDSSGHVREEDKTRLQRNIPVW